MTAPPENPPDLDAIRARVAAASPAPWEPETHAHGQVGCRCLSCEDVVGWLVGHRNALSCDDRVADREAAGERNDFRNPLMSCDAGPLLSWEDANFAAHAREDVPVLLAEIDRLRALVGEEQP